MPAEIGQRFRGNRVAQVYGNVCTYAVMQRTLQYISAFGVQTSQACDGELLLQTLLPEF
jgi:hypothetical protein